MRHTGNSIHSLMSKHYASFAKLVVRDFLGQQPRTGSVAEHLVAAESWLKRAHDRSEHGSDDGVSYGYSVRGGWRPSYRETSGYICTTFFNLAKKRTDRDFYLRAARIAEWLVRVQNSDGSIANPRYGQDGIVFDTGQVLFGLVRAYEETGDKTFKIAARRAADWLVNVADSNGIWSRNEHLNTAHVYNTRSAWALLRMNEVEYHPDRENIARANLNWAVEEQQISGFFNNCAFVKNTAPFTHTIAYATRGLLESGLLLKDEKYISSARRCAEAAMRHIDKDGFIPGQITIDGNAAAKYNCVTGNCQFAISWLILSKVTGYKPFHQSAIRALDFAMTKQDTFTLDADIRGAIPGSYPIWGRYAPLSFPNWATKFFVDAMWMRVEMGDAP